MGCEFGLGMAVAQSAAALCAQTADCVESASAVSRSASATWHPVSRLPQDHGLRSAPAQASSTTTMLMLPGTCTGVEALDYQRWFPLAHQCSQVLTSMV
uniref:Uncharacterized protein n=1 Tax=Triticum urartu TaxID=4572 RepID=A0A8R7PBY2_TRIUA